jgi:hypothetical protein
VTFRSPPFRLGVFCVTLAAVVLAPLAAAAFIASIAINVTGATAFTFTPSGNTNSSTPSVPASTTVVVTTRTNLSSKGGSGGTVTIFSPANIVGSQGGVLNIAWIQAQCVVQGTPGWIHSSGKVTLIAGSSVTCATIDAGVTTTSQATLTVNFFLDATKPLADTYPATTFQFNGTAT